MKRLRLGNGGCKRRLRGEEASARAAIEPEEGAEQSTTTTIVGIAPRRPKRGVVDNFGHQIQSESPGRFQASNSIGLI
ncbi:hypothetical protein SAY86_012754 [Trapa natans]|uniref:Uncharacterized protein n=1 Tax=Trapa natans TaxID=22666 RepID=A0AAN7LXL6_TRANT|nr:hypothetical protein SAY86_012754 [Trapa natans]